MIAQVHLAQEGHYQASSQIQDGASLEKVHLQGGFPVVHHVLNERAEVDLGAMGSQDTQQD